MRRNALYALWVFGYCALRLLRLLGRERALGGAGKGLRAGVCL